MKVMLLSMPREGETVDYTTAEFFQSDVVTYIPLGILSVARGISHRHKVKILDAASLGLSIDNTIAEIKAFEPDVLGLSVPTQRAYAMAEILRQTKVPMKVVGGPHATYYAKETLALGADAVFTGDGDYNFGAWLDGEHKPGIFNDYIEDISSLPFPRYEILNMEDYVVKEREASNTLFKKAGARLTMYSSKGCPNRCVFCDVQEKKFRYKNANRVVDEMEFLLSIGANYVHIMDDCFNTRSDRVLEVCEEIKRRGLKFEWSARGRVVNNYKVIQALSEAGCRRLHVGIESLDLDVLRWMNKNLDVETIRGFCKGCKEFGIDVLAYFMIGTPVETREYRQSLPDMIRELEITYPYFNLLNPRAHTEYYESLLRDGTFKRDYWQEYCENPTPNYKLPLPYPEAVHLELQKAMDRYVKEFYGGY